MNRNTKCNALSTKYEKREGGGKCVKKEKKKECTEEMHDQLNLRKTFFLCNINIMNFQNVTLRRKIVEFLYVCN